MGIELLIQSRGKNERAPVTLVIPMTGAVEDGPLAEDTCREVLRAVMRALDGARQASGDGGLHAFTFSLRGATADGAAQWELREYEVCERAAHFESLHPLLRDYAVVTGAGANGNRMWADAETPAGTHAIGALVLRDRTWLPAYIDFLRSCDLDHEVDQWGVLDQLIEHHGWAPDTCALAAARLLSCRGQHGDEQLSTWMEASLGEYLATEEGRAAFDHAAAREFDTWNGDIMLGALKGPRDAHCGEMDEWLEAFEPLMDPARFAVLRRHAHGRWARERGLPEQ
ncbi:hypothetical protein [Myxococcus sp. AM009]|uniref:hypothetical protein n=1 Tax=Myxococcus sp. AM009 TaxID=2745137 RepID=UPI0015952E3B|nr:hypothetical protein [Myxococcus sp. AM009]